MQFEGNTTTKTKIVIKRYRSFLVLKIHFKYPEKLQFHSSSAVKNVGWVFFFQKRTLYLTNCLKIAFPRLAFICSVGPWQALVDEAQHDGEHEDEELQKEAALINKNMRQLV